MPNYISGLRAIGRHVNEPDVEVITEYTVPGKSEMFLKNHTNNYILTKQHDMMKEKTQ